MDATALHVMRQLALDELHACYARDDQPHFSEIGEAAVRAYLKTCRVPVEMSAAMRAAYATQVVHQLLAHDARR